MAACALVHMLGAVQHWSPGLSVPTIAVALVCLHCVPHLWTAPRTADWVWVTLGSAAMLALHLLMVTHPAGPAHGHGTAAVATASSLDTLTVLGLILPLLGLGSAWFGLGGNSFRVGVPVDDHGPHRGHHR